MSLLKLFRRFFDNPKVDRRLIIGSPADNEILEAAARHSRLGYLPLNRSHFAKGYSNFGEPWNEQSEQLAWDFLCGLCDGFNKILTGRVASERIKPWRVFGFISGSIESNGKASRLADRRLNTYFFTVTAGTLLSNYVIHKKLASLANYFPEVAPTGRTQVVKVAVDEEIEISESRLRFATGLAQFSAWTIFFHELSHILRGHVALVSIADDSNGLSEFDDADSSAANDVRRRAMETDADFYAGVFLGETFLRRGGFNSTLGNNPNDMLVRLGVAVFVAYYSFLETAGYHGGVVRSYVVLAGLFRRIKAEPRRQAEIGVRLMDMISALMQTASFDVPEFEIKDFEALMTETEPEINRIQEEFVGQRPREWMLRSTSRL